MGKGKIVVDCTDEKSVKAAAKTFAEAVFRRAHETGGCIIVGEDGERFEVRPAVERRGMGRGK